MTFICGLVSDAHQEHRQRILGSMVSVLRDGRLTAASWHLDKLSIAVLDIAQPEMLSMRSPAVSPDGHKSLWMAGEIFHAPFDAGAIKNSNLELLNRLVADPDAVKSVDGEYQIALWDSGEMVLSLWNDRFGGLPLYIAVRDGSFMFAGGVRGVLAVPGVEFIPDEDAIREAVTFGGFRLSGRTNIAGVSMVPGATQATWNARTRSLSQRRYWTWAEIRSAPPRDERELFSEASSLWQQAISRRLVGAAQPGQTLSGGLDSRVILAEACHRAPAWTAITYGVHGCDDARYALMAAREAGATWVFMPLYQPGWLELRTRFVQSTDGLIDLHDLGHLESLPLQSRLMDLHLSGYIGDAVSGPTFTDVADARGVLRKLPFYGGLLAMSEDDALARVDELLRQMSGAAPRYALFEHKLPQSTNRWTVAWRPWIRVRKPFTDYELFDFYQGMDLRIRRDENFYERWLLATYPSFFRSIPNQKTGVPILSSWLRWQAARGQRLLRRKVRPYVSRFGLLKSERLRGYTRNEVYWRTPEARRTIEETVLRNDSVTCSIFGRERVKSVLKAWFDSAGVPAQVIGALYVFEAYHRDLAAFIRVGAVASEAMELRLEAHSFVSQKPVRPAL